MQKMKTVKREDCLRHTPSKKEKLSIHNTIVGMTVMHGSCQPAALFRHEGGYAWKWKDEIKDLGDITKERAIQKFEWNFGNRCM